jgi:hypothetical protein
MLKNQYHKGAFAETGITLFEVSRVIAMMCTWTLNVYEKKIWNQFLWGNDRLFDHRQQIH